VGKLRLRDAFILKYINTKLPPMAKTRSQTAKARELYAGYLTEALNAGDYVGVAHSSALRQTQNVIPGFDVPMPFPGGYKAGDIMREALLGGRTTLRL
jgi:DNA-binding transcriptional regulator LsrR (DeoR family)